MKQTGWMCLCFLCVVLMAGLLGCGTMLYGKEQRNVNYIRMPFQNRGTLVMGEPVMRFSGLERSVENAVQLCQEQEQRMNRYIQDIIGEMSLEEKLAQMMILTNEKDITGTTLTTYQPGGIIFFSKDFTGKTASQVRERVDTLQSFMKLPLFVGVDEEGGAVSRISGMAEKSLPQFKSARALYGNGGVDAVREETVEKTGFLKTMGMNLNFDPVADVTENTKSYMYDRSASGKAEQTAEYVETVVTVMKQEKVGSSLKHFPGYGDNVNTHKTYAVDKRSLEEYRERDFVPFQKGIAAGTDMVMVSHIIMNDVDNKNPASLSPEVHRLLREELGFSGVVISDDLNMGAILSSMTLDTATAKALQAGNDMIFSADFMASMKGAKNAVAQELLTEQQIEDSLARILRMKINLGLIEVEE